MREEVVTVPLEIHGVRRDPSVYRSIDLAERLIEAVERIAWRENVSVNRVIVSMIAFGVEELERAEEPLRP